jgi:hypothetical protein
VIGSSDVAVGDSAQNADTGFGAIVVFLAQARGADYPDLYHRWAALTAKRFFRRRVQDHDLALGWRS